MVEGMGRFRCATACAVLCVSTQKAGSRTAMDARSFVSEIADTSAATSLSARGMSLACPATLACLDFGFSYVARNILASTCTLVC